MIKMLMKSLHAKNIKPLWINIEKDTLLQTFMLYLNIGRFVIETTTK